MPLDGRRGMGLRDSVWWLVLVGLLAEKLRVRAGGGLVRASSRPLTQWARPGKEGTGEDRQAERRHKEQNPRWGQITGCVWTRVEMVAQEVRVRDRISRISEESPL